MRAETMLAKKPFFFGLVFLISLLNILPMLGGVLGGDLYPQLNLLDCFASQFWQGDLFPRYCMSSNAGLGAPIFLLYQFLAFYLPVLFYPVLNNAGFDTYQIYIFAIFICGAVSLLTCFSWLRDIVSPTNAFCAAMLYIFLPYRSETLFYRTAFAEPWAIAFMPVVFKYARKLAQGENTVFPYALSIGLVFLLHPITGTYAAIFSGAYILLAAKDKIKAVTHAAIAGFFGLSACSFMYVPTGYFMATLVDLNKLKNPLEWAAGYLTPEVFERYMPPSLLIVLTLLALVIFSFAMLKKRNLLNEGYLKKEIAAWVILFFAALVIFLPISKPLFIALGPTISGILFPWRIQIIFMLSLVYFYAVFLQDFQKQKKTFAFDFALLIVAMMLCAQFLTIYVAPSDVDKGENLRRQFSYFNNYMVPNALNLKTWSNEEEAKDTWTYIPKLRVVSGEGEAQIVEWSWRGITIHTKAKMPMNIIIGQYYYPFWYASDEHGNNIALLPQKDVGLITMEIPQGDHQVTLKVDVDHALPVMQQWLSILLTMFGFAGLSALGILYCRKPKLTLQ